MTKLKASHDILLLRKLFTWRQRTMRIGKNEGSTKALENVDVRE